MTVPRLTSLIFNRTTIKVILVIWNQSITPNPNAGWGFITLIIWNAQSRFTRVLNALNNLDIAVCEFNIIM